MYIYIHINYLMQWIASLFNTTSLPKLVVALRVSFFFLSILHKNRSNTMKVQINSKNVAKNTYYVQILACIMCRF